MSLFPFPSLCRVFGLVVLAALSAPAMAQASAASCDGGLAVAEQKYLDQAYEDVEPLVLDCVYRPTATSREVQQAYRLLALTFIKQDLLTEAQLTIVKIFGVDYAYEADPVADPPFYVALVGAVKEQLRVPNQATRRPPAEPEGEPPSVEAARPIVVDINMAGAAELESVPGIGEATARNIMADRTRNGPFRTVNELQRVRGIGPTNIIRMRPYLIVDEDTFGLALAGGMPEAQAPSVIEPVPPGQLVNLNTATVEELDTLDRIGPTLAARIVEYRRTYGPFKSIEEVTLVHGIGAGTLERFAHQVTVE